MEPSIVAIGIRRFVENIIIGIILSAIAILANLFGIVVSYNGMFTLTGFGVIIFLVSHFFRARCMHGYLGDTQLYFSVEIIY